MHELNKNFEKDEPFDMHNMGQFIKLLIELDAEQGVRNERNNLDASIDNGSTGGRPFNGCPEAEVARVLFTKELAGN